VGAAGFLGCGAMLYDMLTCRGVCCGEFVAWQDSLLQRCACTHMFVRRWRTVLAAGKNCSVCSVRRWRTSAGTIVLYVCAQMAHTVGMNG
jgi:hypothetical protein